jgi:anti-anti-sigma factor
MEDSNVTQITVDMSSTEYVDSSALGMLLMLKNSIASKDDISIKNAKPEVKKILEIANFGQLFSLA